jgi:UDP-N-acetylmuramate dehydrogenase
MLDLCRAHDVDWWVLGRGSNLLVSDQGLRGVAVELAMTSVRANEADGRIEVGAGAKVDDVVDYCEERGLAGAEFLAGIPGTVGGGLCSNAGAFGRSLADIVVEVRGVNSVGEPCVLAKADLRHEYRERMIPDGVIATQVALQFERGRPEPASEARRRRWQKHPSEPSAGSFFRNPVRDGERVPAGRLIEECGLKGRSVGGARVSEKHANFIVNAGGATCADVLELAQIVKARVELATGILLEEEVQLLPAAGRGER